MKKKMLAIASAGGHWCQLNRLRPSFDNCETVYVSTYDYSEQISEKFYSICDANQRNKVGLIIMAFQVFKIILKEKPDIIISTGAAPGFFGLLIGKIFRKKTIWVDSIANCYKMSLSGRKVKPFADLYLTQWPELAKENGPDFKGAVI